MTSQAAPEKTFRSFTSEQGEHYARNRMKYSQALYRDIISHHTNTGGQCHTVLDLGCGPGTATFALARHFDQAVGLDPSEGMISTARTLLAAQRAAALTTADTGTHEQLEVQQRPSNSNVRFERSTAEDIEAGLVPDCSVDLVTAATCAHWFDMPRFWRSAARVLKPGGTVAMWCSNASTIHPSVPNSAAINAAVREMEEAELAPFLEPGNLLTRTLYSALGLPWTVDPPVPGFDEAALFRKEWGGGGGSGSNLDDEEEGEEGKGESESFFEAGRVVFDLDTMERWLGTSGPVIRWREAHPGDVGTERDVIRRMRRVVERLLREAGVEEGKEWVRGGEAGVLLMVKKV